MKQNIEGYNLKMFNVMEIGYNLKSENIWYNYVTLKKMSTVIFSFISWVTLINTGIELLDEEKGCTNADDDDEEELNADDEELLDWK